MVQGNTFVTMRHMLLQMLMHEGDAALTLTTSTTFCSGDFFTYSTPPCRLLPRLALPSAKTAMEGLVDNPASIACHRSVCKCKSRRRLNRSSPILPDAAL